MRRFTRFTNGFCKRLETLPVYKQASQDEISGRNRHVTRGPDDAALGWLLSNPSLMMRRGTVPLVVAEHRNLSITLADDRVAHILSTRAWLLGLEDAGVIESASDIMEVIGRHGRMLSNLPRDIPVGDGDDRLD